jgi:hypothetical protein
MNAVRKFPPFYGVLAATLWGALISLTSARAVVNVSSSETKSLHEFASFGGFAIDPPIHPLSATSSGATLPIITFPGFVGGDVDLRATLKSGTTRGLIAVSAHGYAPGAYTVSVVTESSTTPVVLGSLTVTSGSLSFPIGGPIPLGRGVATTNAMFIPVSFSTGAAKFGGKAHPFPSGFNPFDIASLSLTDSDSAIVATATLTPVPSGFLNAVSPLVAGAAAPGASGYATLHAGAAPHIIPLTPAISVVGGPIPIDPVPPVHFGAPTARIAIRAHGLPASTSFTYAVNGTDISTATSDASGNLNIFAIQGAHGKLPATLDPFSIKTVTVHDSAGAIFVSASF